MTCPPVSAELDQPVAGLPELHVIARATGVATASPGSVTTPGPSGDGSGGIPGMGDGLGHGCSPGPGRRRRLGHRFSASAPRGLCFQSVLSHISGSIRQAHRLKTAMKELSRLIDGLPDYSSFYILLFSDHFTQLPMQKGWTQAQERGGKQYIRWLGRGGADGRQGAAHFVPSGVRAGCAAGCDLLPDRWRVQ